MKKTILLAGFLAFFSISSWALEPKSGWNLKDLEQIPIQAGGRVKPLSTFANEMVLFQTGRQKFSGWNAAELLVSWLSNPEVWQNEKLIQVQNTDAKRQVGLDEKQSRFSYVEITQKSSFSQYVAELVSPGLSKQSTPIAKVNSKENPREQELKSVLDKIEGLRNILSGEAWMMIPQSDASKPWLPITSDDANGRAIRETFVAMVMAYRNDNRALFEESAKSVRSKVQNKIPGWGSSIANKLSVENFYNGFHPFWIAWVLYLISGMLFLFSKKGAEITAFLLMSLGLISHVSGIAMRVYIAGRPPVSNMYESIIWVSFGVLFFASIIFYFQRQKVIFSVACFLATLALIAADAAPAMIDPGIHPLVAVLRSNYWLTIHVLTITISYSALALTLGIGNVTLWQFLKDEKGRAKRITELNQLAYRAMQFGIVLLAAGIILGGVWADYSWGRFWGWDPKEVWALIALLGYLAILHARYIGWVGQFGFPALTILSFLGVVMAWYGVNFVLGVGLHSYGFSAGGQGTVAIFCLLQLSYVGWIAFLRKKQVLSFKEN